MISTKQKQGLEMAEKKLKEIISKNKDYVPALVTMALCKFIQKKNTDARNHLKIVNAKEYQIEYADFFERAWLMLADFFISNNKYDLAEEQLQKCLKHNRSIVKAEEYMGLIKEKEKSYVDAAEHYEKAWRMSNMRNPAVGFRLSFNYMKAQRFVEAVIIGKEILKAFPETTKVQTDIIDKSRLMFR